MQAASELLVLADPVNYVLLVALVQAASKLLAQADLSKTGERRCPDMPGLVFACASAGIHQLCYCALHGLKKENLGFMK